LGGSGNEWGKGVAVDLAGAAYVIGFTSSADFPTMKPQQGTLNGVADAILTKINPKGSGLLYSTYLGGSGQDAGEGIAVDSASTAYVAGGTTSTNFPTKGYLQRTYGGGNSDAFVARIHIVQRPKTTITLSSAPNPSTYGQEVTFTAVLTTGGGAPPDGETVTFKKGTTVLGTGSLSGGSASFTTSSLPVGNNYIKAVYGGDLEFGAGTSNLLKQVVH
jgi:hypothetical protein